MTVPHTHPSSPSHPHTQRTREGRRKRVSWYALLVFRMPPLTFSFIWESLSERLTGERLMDVANSSVCAEWKLVLGLYRGGSASGFYSSYCNFKKNIFIRPTIWTACAGNFVGFENVCQETLNRSPSANIALSIAVLVFHWFKMGLKLNVWFWNASVLIKIKCIRVEWKQTIRDDNRKMSGLSGTMTRRSEMKQA